MIASFECILRFVTSCVSGDLTGVVGFLVLWRVAAAMAETGRESEERRGVRRARVKSWENTLAVVVKESVGMCER